MSFEFNGTHINTLGIPSSVENFSGLPDIDTNLVNVAGFDGSYSNQTYLSNRNLTIKLLLYEITSNSRLWTVRQQIIQNFFTRENAKLILDKFNNYYLLAKLNQGFELTKIGDTTYECELEFICSTPFFYSINPKTYEQTGTSVEFTANNQSFIISYPTLTFTVTQSTTLTLTLEYSNTTISFQSFTLPAGSIFTYNAENKQCYYTSNNNNYFLYTYMNSLEFPGIQSGESSFKITSSTAQTFRLEFTERFL